MLQETNEEKKECLLRSVRDKNGPRRPTNLVDGQQ